MTDLSKEIKPNPAPWTPEFLPGFTWAVPTAFADAVGSCRFALGDTLYDTPNAYESWGKALKSLGHSVQVLAPSSTAAALTLSSLKAQEGQDYAGFREANWGSEVVLELTTYRPEHKTATIETTQGRLLTVLWKGDLGVLEVGGPEPPVPLAVADAHRRLADAAGTFRKFLASTMARPHLFIMACDPTNSNSAAKAGRIRQCLSRQFDLVRSDMPPADCGVSAPGEFFPTVLYRCFAVDTDQSESFRDALKAALWPRRGAAGDASTAETDGKPRTSRLDMARHGLFLSYQVEDDA